MHVAHADDRAEIEFAIEMREQLVIARALPAQRIAERIGIDLDQEQAGLAEEMLARGPGHLRRRGKMNEAVAQVVGAAAIDALPFGLPPGRSGADFVDFSHRAEACLLSLLGYLGRRPNRIGRPG